MRVVILEIRLFLPWAHSLKEKRMERQSLLDKLRRRFNVSAAEVAEQDRHQLLVIGVAAVAADAAQGDSVLDHVLRFVQGNTEAEITQVIRSDEAFP
ncbi:MAG TPA: DUF503 domain-containing protein [Firmicutes bacterium]|nr:DUF503 domain-containing protein [Bacillota bacterium]